MSDAEYEAVMPFVTVTSVGGPHDDSSYVCGFEMGSMDAVLGMNAHLRQLPGAATIHTANTAQADLLAMKHGYTLTTSPIDEFPTHTVVGFRWAHAEMDDDE